jgi:sugar porter (SP) family MFS transporter
MTLREMRESEPHEALTTTAWLIAGIAALSGLLIGYVTAVIAPALQFLTLQFALDPVSGGILVSSVLFGGFVGSVMAGAITRRFGQRPTLIGTGILFVLGSAACALATSFTMLLLWRFVVGLGVGAATMVAPLYVSETAPARWRGGLVSLIQLAITLGILLSYLTGAQWTPTGWWQAMLAVAIAPALIMLVGLCFAPESPRWLLHQGRQTDAERAHRRVVGDPRIPLPVMAEPESGDWRALFGPRLRPVLLLATGLFAFTNLSGIDAILYYAPKIFEDVGFGGTLGPILATSGIGAINVLATLLAMGLVDRLGRRPLLIIGLVPMTFSLAAFALALALGKGSGAGNVLAVLCLGVFITGFAVSLGPLPYVLMSEVFPQSLRGPGMGLAGATAWGVNVIVSFAFLPLESAIGLAALFGVFSLVCAAALVFVVAMVPETRGRSLETIEANLMLGRHVRDLGLPVKEPGQQGAPA